MVIHCGLGNNSTLELSNGSSDGIPLLVMIYQRIKKKIEIQLLIILLSHFSCLFNNFH